MKRSRSVSVGTITDVCGDTQATTAAEKTARSYSTGPFLPTRTAFKKAYDGSDSMMQVHLPVFPMRNFGDEQERFCLPFGPEAYGPAEIREGRDIYVRMDRALLTPFGPLMYNEVIRVRNMDVTDPELKKGFLVLPQWGLEGPVGPGPFGTPTPYSSEGRRAGSPTTLEILS